MRIRDTITRTTTAGEWQVQRQLISKRISQTLGKSPDRSFFKGQYQVLRQYEAFGLNHEDILFEMLPGYRCAGVMTYPTSSSQDSCPAVVCIHGTDYELARMNMLRPDIRPRRAYAIEFARRGFVSISVDQFGFGEWTKNVSEAGLYDQFDVDFPGWSLDGIRLFIQQCAVDILSQHPKVDRQRICCIGNSLGGRTSVFLGALDERIKASVVSTGISPNATNVYRAFRTEKKALSPLLNEAMLKNGRAPWEYEELMSLIAPRGLILLEPFNDPYNPEVDASIECFLKARHVYELLDQPRRLSLICHGQGHDTPDSMREYVYKWVEEVLQDKTE